MKSLIIAVMLIAAVPAFAEGPGKSSPGIPSRSISQHQHTKPADKGHKADQPSVIIGLGGGGGIGTPLGKTCEEVRQKMRWSDMPCSPWMPER